MHRYSMSNKYHYEYRWRCHNLNYGGMTSEAFRSYEMRYQYLPKDRGPHWKLEKFRVYE